MATSPQSALAAPAVTRPADEAQRMQTRLGILLMCVTSFIFATQDTISRQLGGSYSPMLIVMLRYWFFCVFAVVIVARAPGGLRAALRTRHLLLQVARGLLLIADVVMTLYSFVRIGLVNSHAIFAVYPLLVVALSGPVLGERIGWRRWTAVGVGFAGILIILQPGSGGMAPVMLLALGAALCFAVYGLLTRLVSRDDPPMTSFLWTSIAGAAAITPLGLRDWTWMAAPDWGWMGLLCLCAAVSHLLLIRAYALAEASVLQPFAYTQLAWVSVFGIVLFGERLAPHVALGVAVVVGAGLFSLWRSRVKAL